MIFQTVYIEFYLWLLGLWRYSEIEKCDLDAVYRGLLKQPLFLVLVWNNKYRILGAVCVVLTASKWRNWIVTSILEERQL